MCHFRSSWPAPFLATCQPQQPLTNWTKFPHTQLQASHFMCSVHTADLYPQVTLLDVEVTDAAWELGGNLLRWAVQTNGSLGGVDKCLSSSLE